jgi:16S rRNA (cytosine1402-N4)-methyltransferase
MAVYHIPVLLKDCIDALQIRPGGIYVDATFGGGGHSREIRKRLSKEFGGRLFAFDVDPDAVKNVFNDQRFTFIQRNFSEMETALFEYGITAIDGLLADLGVSSHQFDSPERGFSTRFNVALDMRMAKQSGITASEILSSYSEENLKRIFREYGELRNANQIAKRIIMNRTRIRTVNDLKNVLADLAKRGRENQFYARIFQALRIEVNDELNALKELLRQGTRLLKPGGRMAIITYHSLEDRLVKNYFRFGNFEGEPVKDIFGNVQLLLKPVTKKPIVPPKTEIEQNNRARSAKLRVAERLQVS